MQLIKKYANRKLYHTNHKQYITLDGIAGLIQRGEQVRVIDNESGEDITAQILGQVALQARDRQRPLPVNVLTGMIQAGGDTLAGLRRSVWSAIGGASDVDLEIERRLLRLRETGEITEAEYARLLRLLVQPLPPVPAAALPMVPSTGDIERLSAQVDVLSAAVEQLLAERERHRTPPTE